MSLRGDKPAAADVRETPRFVTAKPCARPVPTGIKLTHGERVIDASTGLTKLDLVRYYESIGTWLLPLRKARPMSMVRGPTGVGGQLFFQKHGEKIGIPGIKELDPGLWPGHDTLLVIDTPAVLLATAQMNVIELHTRNSVATKIDQPDRMVFDLDPGDSVAWPQVQEAAMLLRSLLMELGLESWLKTSGGKGLHVVVPLLPRQDYGTVKGFSKAIVSISPA